VRTFTVAGGLSAVVLSLGAPAAQPLSVVEPRRSAYQEPVGSTAPRPSQLATAAPGPATAPAVRPSAPSPGAPRSLGQAAPPSRPVRLDIPALGVEGHVIPLGLDADGALEVPRDADHVGWWSGGARPGAPGPAVFVGHVDDLDGPAVFHGVPRLTEGDVVVVHDAAGTAHTFAVHAVEQHSKGSFPTQRVYGPTATPELRLITCGGRFDEDERSYEDNVIAFARLVPSG
jgi:hypothetical protein